MMSSMVVALVLLVEMVMFGEDVAAEVAIE
jgi:hypothetical protein